MLPPCLGYLVLSFPPPSMDLYMSIALLLVKVPRLYSTVASKAFQPFAILICVPYTSMDPGKTHLTQRYIVLMLGNFLKKTLDAPGVRSTQYQYENQNPRLFCPVPWWEIYHSPWKEINLTWPRCWRILSPSCVPLGRIWFQGSMVFFSWQYALLSIYIPNHPKL